MQLQYFYLMQEIIQTYDFNEIPIVDLSNYTNIIQLSQKIKFAKRVRDICISCGFFYIINHGINTTLSQALVSKSRQFFKLPLQEKEAIHMKKGGLAWRGYFQTGQQYTSGKIDLKQGIYLSEELDESDQRVKKNIPLHGRNLFPAYPAQFKNIILNWIQQMKKLGGILMEIIALSLGFPINYFRQGICKDPTCLFRIFNYPADDREGQNWGVGEHTDYGLITILFITNNGLQVKNRRNQWVKANVIPNSFIINVGDMLERITKGLYRSLLHRVKNTTGQDRLGIPFFYDPSWSAQVRELDFQVTAKQQYLMKVAQSQQRWDKKNLKQVKGIYGEYLINKVSKVFPDLAKLNQLV